MITYTAVVTVIIGNEQRTTEIPCTGGEFHGHRGSPFWDQILSLAGIPMSAIGMSHDGYDYIRSYQHGPRYLVATLHQDTPPNFRHA